MLLEESNNQGNPTAADYIYLDDGRPIATLSPGTGALYFLHDDRLGTPQTATDGSQHVVWSANYQPFGQTGSTQGTLVQDLRLPGQQFEIETGLNHNGFRDYVPNLGRYLQSDPIGLGGGANLYAYVGGNPLRRTDPLGLRTDPSDSSSQWKIQPRLDFRFGSELRYGGGFAPWQPAQDCPALRRAPRICSFRRRHDTPRDFEPHRGPQGQEAQDYLCDLRSQGVSGPVPL
ncbi:hypothetical protein SBA4_3280003 [Candidatus Sulfopaludibacter sp. SbA4]|nr:hypothetical protein SBA4_3280003 [Candidatus Sulfopaludibacter sp. SbA4]